MIAKPEWRFGIEQQMIDRFINRLLSIEVEGRKFRTKYHISMTDGAPQAENFMWVILGNKVRHRELVVERARLLIKAWKYSEGYAFES